MITYFPNLTDSKHLLSVLEEFPKPTQVRYFFRKRKILGRINLSINFKFIFTTTIQSIKLYWFNATRKIKNKEDLWEDKLPGPILKPNSLPLFYKKVHKLKFMFCSWSFESIKSIELNEVMYTDLVITRPLLNIQDRKHSGFNQTALYYSKEVLIITTGTVLFLTS